jgi:beta-lactamase class D
LTFGDLPKGAVAVRNGMVGFKVVKFTSKFILLAERNERVIYQRAGRAMNERRFSSGFSIMNSGLAFPHTNAAVEEERNPDYDFKAFYPARAGEDINRKYRLLSKLGWGSSSTVWLAKDMKRSVGPSDFCYTPK